MNGAQSIIDVSAELPSWGEVLRVLTFSAGFNAAVVVAGTTFLGIAAGLVGTFALLRNRALMGDALAHSALPGICVAYLAGVAAGVGGKSVPLLLFGAAVSGILGVLTVQALVRYTRLSEDTAIGAVLSVYFGVGMVLMSVIQGSHTGSEGGLHHFIYGQTAAMQRSEAVLTAALALAAIALSAVFMKEFRLVCFDEDFAAVQGWPVSLIDLVMMALVVIVTVTGLQVVGLLLIIALLVVPATASRFWTERLTSMCIISAVIGGASGYVGAVASALLPRMPAGAVIVLAAGVLFFISFLFAPRRGVIADLIRRVRLSVRVGREHLLRRLLELAESGRAESRMSGGDLRIVRGFSPLLRMVVLTGAIRDGLIARRGELLSLTDKGTAEARKLTRNHRLWEQYLLTYGQLEASHVDYSADIVEHVLSPELVAELERALQRKGTPAETLAEPPSIHPLAARPEGCLDV